MLLNEKFILLLLPYKVNPQVGRQRDPRAKSRYLSSGRTTSKISVIHASSGWAGSKLSWGRSDGL